MRIFFNIKKYTKAFFSIIYPNLCYVCWKETPINNRNICVNCVVDLPYTDHFEYNNNLVTKKFEGRLPIENGAAFISFYKESRFTDMIHRFKYEGARKVGVMLGEMTGHKFKKTNWCHDIDIIVPVPIHIMRRKKRGYNQSTEYARGIVKIVDIPIIENLLIKSKHTTSQVSKGRRQRLANVAESFALKNGERYRGKHILIIDDVITTGATLEACALRLLDIPDVKISILSLAVARY